jgi:hypothetical protein
MDEAGGRAPGCPILPTATTGFCQILTWQL